MTLLRDFISSIKAPAQRPPQTAASIPASLAGGASTGTLQHLQTYSASGVLFSVVSRISEDVADTEWTLNRTNSRGDLTEIDNHPFLDLWTSPNPFMTQFEFLEASQQHMELAGEIWWLYVEGNPPEMWPLRPDRMRPVPDKQDFIKGYIYSIGNERIPLDVEQVIFIRRPNPLDPYRGIGPVGSMLLDIQGEQAAARWNSQFFQNSAEPGGVIELEEELSDPDWDKFVRRWQQQHQGVSNAHRVAVLERGKWVDRKFTQRDMQFEQLRRFNRDLILEAYGVNKSIMGITEDVNRANAEAGEVNFARRVIKPRLTRLVGVINKRLLPRFGDGLVLSFTDPTPEDREFNLREAVEGYSGQILKLNEARKRLGEEEVPPEEGGDDFFQPMQIDPLGGFGDDNPDEEEEEGQASISGATHRKQDDLLPNPVEEAEAAMQRGWRKRLNDELEALISFIQEHDKGFGPYTKIELSDLNGFDWDWWNKYGDDVAAELARAFQASLMEALPALGLPRAQELASQFAEFRAGELLRLDGTQSMVTQTRERVRAVVSQAIEQGESLRTVQRSLRDDVVFSRSRAETVARTETRIALGQGQKGAAVEQGRNEKRWVTQGDITERDEPCRMNEQQGWIKISNPFRSGQDTVPQHPNCRCTVIYRTAELHNSLEPESKRCPDCQAVFMLWLEGDGVYCRKCKKGFPWPETKTTKRRVIERDAYGRIAGLREE